MGFGNLQASAPPADTNYNSAGINMPLPLVASAPPAPHPYIATRNGNMINVSSTIQGAFLIERGKKEWLVQGSKITFCEHGNYFIADASDSNAIESVKKFFARIPGCVLNSDQTLSDTHTAAPISFSYKPAPGAGSSSTSRLSDAEFQKMNNVEKLEAIISHEGWEGPESVVKKSINEYLEQMCYLCRLSFEVMKDPILLPSGTSIDHSSLNLCKPSGGVPHIRTDPFDGKKTVDSQNVVFNRDLKSGIEKYLNDKFWELELAVSNNTKVKVISSPSLSKK